MKLYMMIIISDRPDVVWLTGRRSIERECLASPVRRDRWLQLELIDSPVNRT